MEVLKKNFKLKALEEDSDYHFEGYGSTYGNADRDGDIMEKGCFDNSLKARKSIPMCLNHDWNTVLGRFDLETDEKGLLVKGFFNLNDPEAKKAYDLMKMGALDSFSIGFIVKDYETIDNKSIYSGIKIKEAELLETSIVTVPANPSATVSSVKSLDIANTIKKELEKQELIKKLEGI